MYTKMERRAIKNNSTSNINAYYNTTAGYHPDLLDLVAEKQPALSITGDSSPSSFPFNNSEALFPHVVLNHTHSEEVWSPLRITSGNKGQFGNRDRLSLLPSQTCFKFSSSNHHQCYYPKIHGGRYVDYSVDSAYGSQASSSADAQSVDDGSSCPGESVRRSPSETSSSSPSSSRFSWVEDRSTRISNNSPLEINNLALPADLDESLVCRLCPWVGSTPSEKRSAFLFPIHIHAV